MVILTMTVVKQDFQMVFWWKYDENSLALQSEELLQSILQGVSTLTLSPYFVWTFDRDWTIFFQEEMKRQAASSWKIKVSLNCSSRFNFALSFKFLFSKPGISEGEEVRSTFIEFLSFCILLLTLKTSSPLKSFEHIKEKAKRHRQVHF